MLEASVGKGERTFLNISYVFIKMSELRIKPFAKKKETIMRKGAAIYCLCVFGLLILLLPSAGQASTLSVNCNTGGKLQTAIGSAGGGDTIMVSGTCNENVDIKQGKKNIKIDGGGTAVIHGTDATSFTVDITGRGITIRRLHITGGSDGIVVHSGGSATIDGNIIEYTNDSGVDINSGSNASVINNTIQNNPNQGINVHDNASAHIGFIHYSDTVAQPNTIQNNGNNGIVVQRSSSATIVGNTIRNNIKNGIYVTKNSHADISDNTLNGNGTNGIYVYWGSGANLGNDTGSSIFDLPNVTNVMNLNIGIKCDMDGYVDGRLGTLNGVNGDTWFGSCLNGLVP
jgi:parallel beta-helix repeat protein